MRYFSGHGKQAAVSCPETALVMRSTILRRQLILFEGQRGHQLNPHKSRQ